MSKKHKGPKVRVVHMLSVWTADAEPGWLVRCSKKGSTLVKLFDEMDEEDASWEPPVKAWFVRAEATRRALDAIDVAKDGPVSFCQSCYQGVCCVEAWGDGRILEEFGFEGRHPEDVGDPDGEEDPFGELLDEVVARARRWFAGGGVDAVPPEIAAAAVRLEVTWPISREELDAAFKAAALKHHPDRGGSDAAMAEVNAARDVLLRATQDFA